MSSTGLSPANTTDERPRPKGTASSAFDDYFRCPPAFAKVGIAGTLSGDEGFFTFRDAICYGRRFRGPRVADVAGTLPDLSGDVTCEAGQVRLPFDLSEVVTNLQQERYCGTSDKEIAAASSRFVRRLYYFLRPALPPEIRKHLQRFRLRGWEQILFPRWPVDFTVQTLMERSMALVLKSSGTKKIPFIWFWPDGAPSCGMMTHDVEDRAGRDFCDQLMDLDDEKRIKSAFQVIPEVRYGVSEAFLERLRARGFEVNVHDLNHDGQLYNSRQKFQRRAKQIQHYRHAFKSRGFRSGAMYRQQAWFDALDFSYDMSVPNVAHLEPQRGGCCTVMPYFIGDLLELPLTTIQDYSLFHILGDYSIELWKTQIDLIAGRNGLISFITHPDYLIEARARAVYRELLGHLHDLRDAGRVWVALPGEVDRWWRSRSQMTLTCVGDSWRIEGPDCDRARVAYASLEGDQVVYRVETPSERA